MQTTYELQPLAVFSPTITIPHISYRLNCCVFDYEEKRPRNIDVLFRTTRLIKVLTDLTTIYDIVEEYVNKHLPHVQFISVDELVRLNFDLKDVSLEIIFDLDTKKYLS